MSRAKGEEAARSPARRRETRKATTTATAALLRMAYEAATVQFDRAHCFRGGRYFRRGLTIIVVRPRWRSFRRRYRRGLSVCSQRNRRRSSVLSVPYSRPCEIRSRLGPPLVSSSLALFPLLFSPSLSLSFSLPHSDSGRLSLKFPVG